MSRDARMSANTKLVGDGPKTLYWYMTNNCNLSCSHCWVVAGPDNAPPNIPFDSLKPFFQEAVDLGLTAVKLTGCEPTLHKDFDQTCQFFSERGVAVWLETNGLLLSDDRIKMFCEMDIQVGISLDHAQPDEHDEFRGRVGAFDTSVEAMRKLLARSISIGVTSSLSESNISELPQLAALLLDDVGVNHVALNPIVPFGRATAEEQQEMSESWTAYLDRIFDAYWPVAERYGVERFTLNLPPALTTSSIHQRCLLGDDVLSVLANGDVSICSFGVDDDWDTVSFGSALTDSLSNIWNTSEGISRLRQPGRSRLKGICQNCFFVNACRGYCRAVTLSVCGDVDGPFPYANTWRTVDVSPTCIRSINLSITLMRRQLKIRLSRNSFTWRPQRNGATKCYSRHTCEEVSD